MEDIKELLHKIRRFIDEDEILKKEKSKRGEDFNVFKIMHVENDGRIQRANALRRKVIKSFRKNTQKEYKNLIFLLVED